MAKDDQKTAGENIPEVLDPKPEKTSKVHVLVGVEFTLLNVKFTAGF